jgi:hypothetical protein
MRQPQNERRGSSWRTQLYVLGAAIGAAMGFLSAYLFAKEAAQDADADAESRPEISPTALLGLALSVITLVRQIAETGRKKDSKKK